MEKQVTSPIYRTRSFINWSGPKFWPVTLNFPASTEIPRNSTFTTAYAEFNIRSWFLAFGVPTWSGQRALLQPRCGTFQRADFFHEYGEMGSPIHTSTVNFWEDVRGYRCQSVTFSLLFIFTCSLG
jgi:hypothetical protein